MPNHKVDKWAHDKWTFSNKEFVKRLGMPPGTPFFNVEFRSYEQKIIVHVNVKTQKNKDAWGREVDHVSHETWEFDKREALQLLGLPVNAPVFFIGKNHYDGSVEITASHRDYPEPPKPEPEPEGEEPSASEQPNSSWWTSITSRFRSRHQ